MKISRQKAEETVAFIDRQFASANWCEGGSDNFSNCLEEFKAWAVLSAQVPEDLAGILRGITDIKQRTLLSEDLTTGFERSIFETLVSLYWDEVVLYISLHRL